MSFDKEAFLEALAIQCEKFGLEHDSLWQLAPNVFAAVIRSRGADEWSVVYYFDNREVKVRDKDSNEGCMDRTIQLFMMGGFMVGPIVDGEDEYARVAYIEEAVISPSARNILNCATQLFARTDNGEIEWLEQAESVMVAEKAV